MIISLDNLNAGLEWWDKKWGKKAKFSRDIHNADYYNIYGLRTAGVTKEWWDATVNRLGQWRAYRGKPWIRKEKIIRRGRQRLSKLAAQYAKLKPSPATEPCITELRWEDVASLFGVASEIRRDIPGSPVFSCKMCHFLFPKVFIVMDNQATSTFEYEFYWRGMQDEWRRFKNKDEARNRIMKVIRSNTAKPLHPLYPFETKIMELSHIGWKHR